RSIAIARSGHDANGQAVDQSRAATLAARFAAARRTTGPDRVMIVTSAVLLIAIAMMVVERVRPGRAFPTPRTWWLRALALNLVQVRYAVANDAQWQVRR